jgi:peroxiredoxin
MEVKIGKKAPDFEVQLSENNSIGLSNYAGAPLVLIFIRHLA